MSSPTARTLRTPHASRRPVDPVPAGRFLTRDECADLFKRTAAVTTGGGSTTLFVNSHWEANVRWARNQVISSGDIRRNTVNVQRNIRGAGGGMTTNQLDDAGLTTAVRHAERALAFRREWPGTERFHQFVEPYPDPKVWSEATYRQTAEERAELMRRLVGPAAKAGMLSAGYVEVSAHGESSLNGDTVWYYPYTLAQCSVTVRVPDGSGSGWAGADHHDWSKLDVEAIANTALEKCLKSRNPVRVEPGRYETILEPQAVVDLCGLLFSMFLSRQLAESDDIRSPFGKGKKMSKLTEKVIDDRLTVSVDPMDPACAFPPFFHWQVFHPATWIKDGVLTDLSYGRDYAVSQLEQNTGGLVATGAFRMHGTGEPTSVDEMIATTKRGILVTRFWGVASPTDTFSASMVMSGYTRDGTWLVEDGKIKTPIKNFRFSESPIFALNRIEQIGAPKRVFRPQSYMQLPLPDMTPIPPGYAPAMAPALKVRDFNFVALTDAV